MSRPRIVIVGAGFAGYRTARTLSRLTRHQADITLLNPTDYFLYLPLLPQVAAGILEPRRVSVSLSGTLPHVRLVLGEADGIDLDGHTVHYTGPEGEEGTLPFDRLVLAAGSVNKLLPVPGVAEHAHGFRGLPEALYLRDHVTRQVELAAAAKDRAECAARCTFVVVGAGYTGTEVAAHGAMYTDAQVRRHPMRTGMRPRWMLLDVAPRVLPEMDERLSRTAERVLRQRGVDVRMGTSVEEATHDGVLLTDGSIVDTRTLVWCVGVRPDPLVESLGLPLERGRLLVDSHLRVPGRPEVFACGDVAAVPDLNQPGQYTPMTAQHAWRHGKVCAQNVAASLGVGRRRAYRHRDMGFVVDLGGAKAAANPLGLPMSGPAAGAVTRGYHLAAMPGNRVRVAADWLLDAVLPRQAVQLGLVRSWSVPLESASPEVARVPGRPERARRAGTGTGERDAVDPGAERAGEERSEEQPAGSPSQGRPSGEPAKNQPGGEPAKNQPGGEPAKNQPHAEPREEQPHGSRSGSTRASGTPRRAAETAGPPARGTRKPRKTSGTSGATRSATPAAPSGPTRSADGPADPGPEPPADQPPPGPDIAPGPVKRTDGRAAEGDS
ncbi:FAD-dependent oxidoreductase [Streptomyces olivaceus]|uniref:NAD(P)/FAD-dependent oxidoreductase n=1 Tax=Streptomyces olivaceus TaxID=47716 RepID=UPI001CCFD652|nr:NAD(P)/FAD-dependent oxidoreductase [Streptomyces olivaceus]MBZ6172943.1 FAD-dependent oxidoreductase [Streptomyces olivaceus]MBZ6181206.1 FAD-dependent oxidoreductase [Streptomyces olivaceus]